MPAFRNGALNSMMPRAPAGEPYLQRMRRYLPGAAVTNFFVIVSALFLAGHDGAYQTILWQLGINPFYFPFLDAHGVLATAQCHRDGFDVITYNPCDTLGRILDYSPFWLVTAKLGLSTRFTTEAGLVLDLLFLACVFLLPQPRGWAGTAAMILALLSSAVAFALERANLDLAVFAAGVVAARASLRGPAWRLIGYALVMLAALVKYYPGIMLMLAIRERARFFYALVAVTLGIAALFVVLEGADLLRAFANIESGDRFSNNFGAINLPLAFTILASLDTGHLPSLIEAGGLLIAAWLALRMAARDALPQALAELGPRVRAFMLIGCALLLGCFVTAQNAPYRGIYFLFVLPGLTQLWGAAKPARQRAMLASAGALFLLWGQFLRRGLIDALVLAQVPAPLAGQIQLGFWFLREFVWWWVATMLMALLFSLIERSPAWERLGALDRFTRASPSLRRDGA